MLAKIGKKRSFAIEEIYHKTLRIDSFIAVFLKSVTIMALADMSK